MRREGVGSKKRSINDDDNVLLSFDLHTAQALKSRRRQSIALAGHMCMTRSVDVFKMTATYLSSADREEKRKKREREYFPFVLLRRSLVPTRWKKEREEEKIAP